MPHTHQLVDGDSRFLIDVDTRAISNKLLKKKILIQHDHNSELYSF